MPDTTTETNQLAAVPKMETRQFTLYNRVRKSKTIIEARYHLTQPETKILNAIFSVINDYATELGYIELSTKELCANLKINLRELKEFTYNIVKSGVTFRSIDDDGVYKDVQTTWLSAAVYYPSLGIVRFRISEELKPYIIGISQRKEPYTEFETRELISTTHYTNRIYELAKQFAKVGRRPAMSIEELRAALGIPEDKYPLFANFRVRILDTAVAAIRSNKDMGYEVGYELIRDGRAYKSVVLTIRHKQRGSYLPTPKGTAQPEQVADVAKLSAGGARIALGAFGLKGDVLKGLDEAQLRYLLAIVKAGMQPKVLGNLLQQHSFAELKANNELVLEKVRNGKCKSYGAMLVVALKHDWASDVSNLAHAADKAERQKRAEISRQARKQVEKEVQRKAEAAEQAFAKRERISDMEITLINRQIEQGNDPMTTGITKAFLARYAKKDVPRIQEALALVKAGQKIPTDFFVD